jgi:hypothetical protein
LQNESGETRLPERLLSMRAVPLSSMIRSCVPQLPAHARNHPALGV